MIALAGTGQQIAALELYEDARRRLDEYGTRPGPVLSGAHVRVLRQDLPAGPGSGSFSLGPLTGHTPEPAPAGPGNCGDGFDRFYQDNLRAMIARAYLLHGDQHQAEQAAQGVFVAAFQDWARLKDLTRDDQRLYLMKALTSSYAAYERFMPVHVQAMAKLKSSGQFSHIDEEAADEPIRAMQSLPPPQRIIAVMHLAEKIPLPLIAREMGISVSGGSMGRLRLAQGGRADSARAWLTQPAPRTGAMTRWLQHPPSFWR